MLNSIYETLARKKSLLRSEIDQLLKIRNIEKYRGLWRSANFSEAKVKIGAEDGSFNFKKYKNFVLYAVNAVAYTYNGKIKEVQSADINILRPYKKIEDRLKLYQSIFELKTAIKAIDEVDLFLLDGSLLSELNSLREIEAWLTPEERKECMSLVKEFGKSKEVEIVSAKFSKELDKFEKVAFLEYLEYLDTAGKLLERGLEKLVGVSKSSTSTEFNEGISDLAVFEEATKVSGFSKPFYKPLGVVPKKFPLYDELLRSLVFTTFYARLEDNKNVFMFEIPREVEEGEILSTLSKIKSICIDGYPYLLRKAHRKAVISNRDVKSIFNSLGIIAKTGREML